MEEILFDCFFLSLFTGVGHHLDIFVLNNDFISCLDCSRCLLVCFIVNIYILLGISSFQLHRVRQCAIWRQLFGNVSIFKFLFNSPSLSAFFNVLAFPFNVYFKNVAFFYDNHPKTVSSEFAEIVFLWFLVCIKNALVWHIIFTWNNRYYWSANVSRTLLFSWCEEQTIAKMCANKTRSIIS